MTETAAATEATESTETTESTEGSETTVTETTSLKPEGLEESFWDAEKNEVRLDSLIKSYADTRKAVHTKEESLREKFMADLQKARPENPDGYQVPEDIGVELPGGSSLLISNDDPLLGMWRKLAFQNNLNNDQFMEGVRAFVETNLSLRPDPTAELEKLGENGQDRVTRLDNLMSKHLEIDEVNRLADFMGTAEGVVILEKLVSGINPSAVADTLDAGDLNKALTLGELQTMQQDPRYTGRGGVPRDNDFIKRVEKGFQKLYPGKAVVSQNR